MTVGHRWLFGRRADLLLFGGTAALALLAVAIANALGAGVTTSGEATWVVSVLLVDVAHVWSTAFVVYLDPAEFRRRRTLYTAVPIASYAVGFALYRQGPDVFWRVIAYLAIFHFVRQQWGWVAMYRGRNRETGRLGRALDAAMVYATTLYPLLVWHTQLPRNFWWMREGDMPAGLPTRIAPIAGVIYALLAIAYCLRAIHQARRGFVAWGKHVVILSTAACWYVGIVATNSDFAFTVTNVFIHGIPYAALVFVYAIRTAPRDPASKGLGSRIIARGFLAFAATCWALAYAEELLWDRFVWHDREWLFGSAAGLGDHLHAWLVPALVVPQLTHYILDGFLWRRSNPRLALV